jgi:hypothetical protein
MHARRMPGLEADGRRLLYARVAVRLSVNPTNILPTHPDRCGGLGFLALVSYAFSPLLPALGVLLAGMVADRIFYAGAKLTDSSRSSWPPRAS